MEMLAIGDAQKGEHSSDSGIPGFRATLHTLAFGLWQHLMWPESLAAFGRAPTPADMPNRNLCRMRLVSPLTEEAN
jgi:hypothetical protein